MFGIDSGELLIIALIALVVIGPKDLPKAMRVIGQWVGRARGMARHFRSGIDTMIREVELEEMEKQWKANNERIMRESPAAADSDWGRGDDIPASPGPAAAPAPEPASAPAPEPAAEPGAPEADAPELPFSLAAAPASARAARPKKPRAPARRAPARPRKGARGAKDDA